MRHFAHRMRLIWLDAALESKNMVRRSDLVDAFGISTPQASSDIQAYRTQFSDHITYDLSAKGYRSTGKAPVWPDKVRAAVTAAVDAIREMEEPT